MSQPATTLQPRTSLHSHLRPGMSQRTFPIDDTRSIQESEFDVRTTRASGPGGQHVNKTATRVEVTWYPERSIQLTDEEKARVRRRLSTRLAADGGIRAVSGRTRSQLQNRLAAMERLAELVGAALHVPRARKATKPTRASKEARLSSKKREGAKKRDRRKVAVED